MILKPSPLSTGRRLSFPLSLSSFKDFQRLFSLGSCGVNARLYASIVHPGAHKNAHLFLYRYTFTPPSEPPTHTNTHVQRHTHSSTTLSLNMTHTLLPPHSSIVPEQLGQGSACHCSCSQAVEVERDLTAGTMP